MEGFGGFVTTLRCLVKVMFESANLLFKLRNLLVPLLDDALALFDVLLKVSDSFSQCVDVLILIVNLFLERCDLAKELLFSSLACSSHFLLLLLEKILKFVDDVLKLSSLRLLFIFLRFSKFAQLSFILSP